MVSNQLQSKDAHPSIYKEIRDCPYIDMLCHHPWTSYFSLEDQSFRSAFSCMAVGQRRYPSCWAGCQLKAVLLVLRFFVVEIGCLVCFHRDGRWHLEFRPALVGGGQPGVVYNPHNVWGKLYYQWYWWWLWCLDYGISWFWICCSYNLLIYNCTETNNAQTTLLYHQQI